MTRPAPPCACDLTFDTVRVMSEPLLLLPGMMCDARLFRPQIEAVSAQRPVMVAPVHARDSFSELASCILASAPKRFALAGISFGGIVAMEVVRQAPGRVSRLALMDTNPRAETPQKSEMRESQINSVLAGNLQSVMRDEMKPHYLLAGSGRQGILDTCMDMAMTLGPDVFVRQSRALQSRPDQTPTLESVQVPTLVLCGEGDRLCPVDAHQQLCSLIRTATLAVIPGAGHLPTLEQPELTNKVLNQWLNQ